MDIQALSLLEERYKIHVNLASRSKEDILKDIRGNEAKHVTEDSKTCILKVTDYSKKMKNALDDLEGKVKEYNMKIGEVMVELSKEGFTLFHPDGKEVSTVKREYFDMMKAKKLQEMQQLAKQQNELLQLMNETHKVIAAVEEEGEISIEALNKLRMNVDHYSETIETEENRQVSKQLQEEGEDGQRNDEQKKREEDEKGRKEEQRKRDEEERRRKEEERRQEEERRLEEEEQKKRNEEERQKREEEERQKREEEERQKREERRKEEKRKKEEQRKKEAEMKRLEAEKRRLNPDNWPTHRYMRKDADIDSYHMNICCLVSAVEGSNGFSKNDISCTVATEETDMQSCLHRGDTLQSNFIKLICTEDRICLEAPMMVYIPYKVTEASREIILRIKINNGAWKHIANPKKTPKDAEENIFWLGTEINNFKTLDMVVVSRIRAQIISINPNGGTFTADADPRTRVIVPPDCVQGPASLNIKVANNVEKSMKNRRDLDNVAVVSVTHDISCDSILQKDATLQMFLDSTKKLPIMSHTNSIQSCREKLEAEMNLDPVLEYMQQEFEDPISSFCSEIKNGKEDAKTKTKKLIDYIASCSTKEFESFLEALRITNQTYLAQLLEAAYHKKSNTQSSDSDSDMQDSDFEGDIKVVVMGSEESDTTILTRKELNIDKNMMNINLPKGRDSYSVVGFIAPRTMDDNDIRTTANKLQTLSIQTPVAVIIRQKINDPSEVCIVCILEDEVDKTFKDLEDRGFVSGPKGFVGISIGDGDKVTMTTTGNIEMVSKDQTNISLQYFSIKGSVETVFIIKEKDSKGKLSRGQYFGRIQFFVEGQGKTLMTDSVTVYLPVGDDFQRYAPIALDAEVAVTAKHVATILTMMNQSPEKFFSDLAGADYTKLFNRAHREYKTGTDRDKFEAFIVNWAAQRPRSENKVEEILNKMKKHYPDLAEKTKTFVNLYNGKKGGMLSTKSLEKIADSIESKWEDVAQALQIDKSEIVKIKQCFQNERLCAMRMLDQWRYSNDALEREDVIEHFLSALRSAKCSSTTIEMVEKLSKA